MSFTARVALALLVSIILMGGLVVMQAIGNAISPYVAPTLVPYLKG